MAKHILAFDIYGTLLDTSSIAQALCEHLELDNSQAAEVSSLWRRYQLEYTWRLNSMNIYEPFDIVTQKSLQHALKDSGIIFNDATANKLMNSYNILPCFSDSMSALQKLANNEDVRVFIFSNGTLSMVQSALAAAGITQSTSDIYVADAVQRYKPAPEIYKGLLQAAGKEMSPSECWLISGNPFDVTGALSQGMRAIWVDRAGKGWSDTLLPIRSEQELQLMKVVHGLAEIPELIALLT